MKSQLNWHEYQKLELIDQAHPAISLFAKLNDLWQRAIAYLSTSSEPYVWHTQVGNQLVWNAYDPISHRTIERVSAEELRVWLEERHYQAC